MSKVNKHKKAVKESTEVDNLAVNDENTPGKQLKRAREALGLTQEQVAERLHLRPSSVEAVEQDALEDSVSVTFNKGYVRLYARLVRLDTEPLLEAYDRIHKQDDHPAKLQSFSRRVSREAHDQKWNMVTIVVVLLVLGSVIGWWIQQSDSLDDSQSYIANTFDNLFSESENDQSAQNTNIRNEVAQALPIDPMNKVSNSGQLDTGPKIPEELVANIENNSDVFTQNADEIVEKSSSSLSETTESYIENPDSNVDKINDPSSTASNSQKVSDVDEKSDSTVTPKSDLPLVDDKLVKMAFTFKKDCWVSIKDVNNEVIAIGVKAKGRVMKVSGLPPIQVILCAPQYVDVTFDDKEINMSKFDTSRTAKFTLPVEAN